RRARSWFFEKPPPPRSPRLRGDLLGHSDEAVVADEGEAEGFVGVAGGEIGLGSEEDGARGALRRGGLQRAGDDAARVSAAAERDGGPDAADLHRLRDARVVAAVGDGRACFLEDEVRTV